MVVDDLDVDDLEIVDVFDLSFKPNPGDGGKDRFTRKLFFYTVDLVEVDVAIASAPNELFGGHVCHLGDGVDQNGILGNVERCSQRKVLTAATQFGTQVTSR